MRTFDPTAPVIIAVGESSRKTVPGPWPSPVQLAGQAIRQALIDSGKPLQLADAITCVAAIRTFEDSGVAMGVGSPDNVAEAYANAGGITADHYIYGDVGGQSPQALVHKLAGAVQYGLYQAVMIVGAEAKGTTKRARRAQAELDWRLPSDTVFDDQRTDFAILNRTEIRNGIISMPLAYSLLENARRLELGLDQDIYQAKMAELVAALSVKSLTRDHAQFARHWTEQDLCGDAESDYLLTDIYRRWRVAQDAVDLGAAIIITSAGKARELGIADNKMIWLAGAAEASEPPLSERANIASADALDFAMRAALDQAGVAATALGPVDIYSCFPVAVFAAIDPLGDPARSFGDYTLTGGLGFFGGPGNGYSLHAIAAMVQSLRRDGTRHAMITANGGVMSKQAVGIYMATQPETPWSGQVAKGYEAQLVTLDPEPKGRARIISFTRPAVKNVLGHASLLLEMESGLHTVAVINTPPDTDIGGQWVDVIGAEKRHNASLV